MKTRAYSMVTQHQRCEYCADALLGSNKAFYLFPCSHGFHCHCLVQRCHAHLSPQQVNSTVLKLCCAARVLQRCFCCSWRCEYGVCFPSPLWLS
jgi:hypothetical protein